MLVVFDARAQSVPLWLAASGFVLWEGIEVEGAQYRIPYVYKVRVQLSGMLIKCVLCCKKTQATFSSCLVVSTLSQLLCTEVWPQLMHIAGCVATTVGLFNLSRAHDTPIAHLHDLLLHYYMRFGHRKRINFEQVYRKKCLTGLVWLGGNGARGSNGAKRNYFVLSYVPRCHAELTTSPEKLSLQPYHDSSSDHRGVGDTLSVAGSPMSTRQIRPALSVSPSSPRSLTHGFSSVTTSEAGDHIEERSVTSVPSSPTKRSHAGLQQSAGSRSFESLDGLATSDKADAGRGARGVKAGNLYGPENFASRSREFSMSDAGVDAKSRSLASGVGTSENRSRAWTGGGENAARDFNFLTDTLSSSVRDTNAGSGINKQSSRVLGGQSASLQRISALWDTDKDGPLSQIPVPFDRVGRQWSRTFNVDAANTAGPLETSGATLGVSVSALTGEFHRTRVVTLYPRLIVRNFLDIPLEVCMSCVML